MTGHVQTLNIDNNIFNHILEHFKDVLSSNEFSDYLREMSKACTDETLRQKDNPDDHSLGVQGTFRTLSVD